MASIVTEQPPYRANRNLVSATAHQGQRRRHIDSERRLILRVGKPKLFGELCHMSAFVSIRCTDIIAYVETKSNPFFVYNVISFIATNRNESVENMAQFGVKVRELLLAAGKDASWLAAQTGIANSTISNWLSDPKVQPKPSSVVKVAAAFGVTVDELAPAAGYVIRQSADDTERAARRDALLIASPRWEDALDRLAQQSAYHQDVALSMVESYIKTLP